ncbi:magnesium/cobalt transporter CorA [soil metagenome]
MIVDCAIYRDGHRQAVNGDLGKALQDARCTDGFVWIGLHEPDQSEFARVTAEFGLHALAVEDAVKAHQRPKLEAYGDTLFLVLKTLRYVDRTSDIESGELMLFVGDSFVVSVRHGQANPLAQVRRRLESRDEILRCGPSAVLYAVCDAVVDTYTEISAEVQLDVEAVESRVFSADRSNDAEAIYRLKRELLEFRHAVTPLVEPMRALAGDGVDGIHVDTRPFFRDVADHVVRVGEQVDACDDLLTGILNANLAQVSVRQNEDMRRISAWVAIVAVPTLVAGIYGMNFTHMPELTWRYGYPLSLALMLAICAVLYRAFKRSGWL